MPGFALASAISSATLAAGSFGAPSSTNGELPIIATGAKSLTGSYGGLADSAARGRVRGRVGEPDRVAVRLCARDRLGADDAAGADAVVDHDLLAEPLGQLLADDAGDGVGAAAGLERHDQADRALDRPAPVALRAGDAPRHCRGKESEDEAGHEDISGFVIRASRFPDLRTEYHEGSQACIGLRRSRSASRRLSISEVRSRNARASFGILGGAAQLVVVLPAHAPGPSPPAAACCGWSAPACAARRRGGAGARSGRARRRSASPRMILISLSARLKASWMPLFMPMAPIGLFTCAESPARIARPVRNFFATRWCTV